MRCFICNAVLTPEEVHYNRKYEGEKYGPYDPCGRCLTEIDAAFEDVLEENEIDFGEGAEDESELLPEED